VPTLTCPGCGSTTEIARFDKAADEFCATCDYPLFWAVGPDVMAYANGEPADTTLKRLPGAAGRRSMASAACPTCSELNPLDAETCLRCGGPMMLPEPEPEPEPPPPPPPEPEPEPEPEPTAWIWWVLLGMGLLLTLLVVLLVL
jgi:ribosomal protein L40E